MSSKLVHDPNNNVQTLIKIYCTIFKNSLNNFGKSSKRFGKEGWSKPPPNIVTALASKFSEKYFSITFDIVAVYMKCKMHSMPSKSPKNVSPIDVCVIFLETRV